MNPRRSETIVLSSEQNEKIHASFTKPKILDRAYFTDDLFPRVLEGLANQCEDYNDYQLADTLRRYSKERLATMMTMMLTVYEIQPDSSFSVIPETNNNTLITNKTIDELPAPQVIVHGSDTSGNIIDIDKTDYSNLQTFSFTKDMSTKNKKLANDSLKPDDNRKGMRRSNSTGVL